MKLSTAGIDAKAIIASSRDKEEVSLGSERSHSILDFLPLGILVTEVLLAKP